MLLTSGPYDISFQREVFDQPRLVICERSLPCLITLKKIFCICPLTSCTTKRDIAIHFSNSIYLQTLLMDAIINNTIPSTALLSQKL